MTVSETYTAIGDAIRRQYGTTDKYSLLDMPKMIDCLELRNFLAGNSFEATFQNGWISKDLTGPDVDTWNKYIAGKTVTFSCDAEWTGYIPGARGDRFFFEFMTTTTDDQPHWNGLYFTPTIKEGKQHITSTIKVSDLPVKSINSIKFWDELNEGSHLKVTNIKMTVNPLGGINSEVLLNTTPDKEFSGKAYAFYSDFNLHLQPGATYELSLFGKNDQIASSFNQYVFAMIYKPDWSWEVPVCNVPMSTEYHKSAITFTVPKDITDTLWLTVYLWHGDNGNDTTDKQRGTGYAKDIMLRRIF